MSLLPPVPLASLALAIGALGGAAGARIAGHPDQPWSPASATASVQAAVVAPDDAGEDQAAGRRHVAWRASDGMFYVWAKVNGRPVRFLVDTGASVVVLNAADAAASGVRAGAYSGRMLTAGGNTAMAWTKVDDIVIGGHHARGMRAAIMRNGPGVSLLGANMLSRLETVRIEGDRLELG